MPRAALAAAAGALALAAGCGGSTPEDRRAVPPPHDPTAAAREIGPAPLWRPSSLSRAMAAGRPVRGRLRCSRIERPRFGVHLELFAAGRVVLVPAGIGVAPPRRRDGAYVRGGRCSYPVRTREPTGVLELERPLRLGDLFAVWGRRLSPRQMLSFGGRVSAYVGGRPWRRDPRAIPLTRHAQIVLELGGHVPPHVGYRFQPGL